MKVVYLKFRVFDPFHYFFKCFLLMSLYINRLSRDTVYGVTVGSTGVAFDQLYIQFLTLVKADISRCAEIFPEVSQDARVTYQANQVNLIAAGGCLLLADKLYKQLTANTAGSVNITDAMKYFPDILYSKASPNQLGLPVEPLLLHVTKLMAPYSVDLAPYSLAGVFYISLDGNSADARRTNFDNYLNAIRPGLTVDAALNAYSSFVRFKQELMKLEPTRISIPEKFHYAIFTRYIQLGSTIRIFSSRPGTEFSSEDLVVAGYFRDLIAFLNVLPAVPNAVQGLTDYKNVGDPVITPTYPICDMRAPKPEQVKTIGSSVSYYLWPQQPVR